MKKILMATIAAAGLASCAGPASESGTIIDKPEFTSPDGVFSIEALEALGRVSAPAVSPDGSKLLYSVSYESVEENASNADLYVADLNNPEAPHSRITRSAKSEGNAVWLPSGEIAFLYPDADGKSQIWLMDADGNNRRQVSNEEKSINGFLFSPNADKVLLIQNVKNGTTVQDIYPDLPKANCRLHNDLMYKHWDEWVTEIPHPFIADFNGKEISNSYDVLQDEPYESPLKPFGGVESFAWSPDGTKLIYTSRKQTGVEYAVSTASDLYIHDLTDKSEKRDDTNLTLKEGLYGYQTCPTFSPDGTHLAWLSMEHDGYESDKNRIMVMNLASGEIKDLTADWDYTVDAIAWAPDGQSLFFLAYNNGVKPVFSVDFSDKVTTVASGECDYDALVPLPGGDLITMRHSMLYPNEIYRVSNGEATKITAVNDEIFAQLTMPTVERRYVPTTDGKQMLTWIVKPQNFDPAKKYPAVLYCQGGPQQAVSQFWSYRWNLALMAANGYVMIAPNRRGLPGFGTEWNAQISGDYPGQNMRDYLVAVDDVKREPWIDAEHIGATGASYGGFSVYWLAGNHDGRFACLIAHAGIFNMEAQYLETEEMWFANWDMGGGMANAPVEAMSDPCYGAYWRKDNPTAQRTFEMSPHKFVDKWTAPILITHGEFDYRILSSQGEMAFNAAKLRGIPAEMAIFPDENHWILKPQNAILWQRLFFRWLDRWLKPAE